MTTTINIGTKLTVHNIKEVYIDIVNNVDDSDYFVLDISDLTDIDITGFQLLCCLIHDSLESKININLSGVLTDEFIKSINEITFSENNLSTVEDLIRLIKAFF